MNLVTLRNLPSELVIAIRRRAKEQGSSLKQGSYQPAAEKPRQAPTEPERAVYHDLDALAGSWSKEEAARFEVALRDQRAI